MAGTDSPKQLLTLIREFAAERSKGERRVSDLRKRSLELQTALDSANADVDSAKRSKEAVEQDLRCFEVESSIKDASIQAQEARISLLQQEISKLECHLGNLKNDENVTRDDFINKMFEFNKKLRKLQESSVHYFHKDAQIELSSNSGEQLVQGQQASFDIQDTENAIEEKIALLGDQIHIEEQEYQQEENIHKEVLQEQPSLERRVFLMETITKETKELQDLARQTAESEKEHGLLTKLMQRRYACPNCQLDDMVDLGETVSS